MASLNIAIAPAYGRELESETLNQPPEPPAQILSVSPFPGDHLTVGHVVENSPWRFTAVRSTTEACQELNRSQYTVVFCESFLSDGTWKDMLDIVSGLDDPPLLVVISQLADEYLWAEVLNFGGYDVLAKPLVEDEVRRVLHLAMTHRARPAGRPRVFHTAC
jgi:DNA-binding NtrC family response regulator